MCALNSFEFVINFRLATKISRSDFFVSDAVNQCSVSKKPQHLIVGAEQRPVIHLTVTTGKYLALDRHLDVWLLMQVRSWPMICPENFSFLLFSRFPYEFLYDHEKKYRIFCKVPLNFKISFIWFLVLILKTLLDRIIRTTNYYCRIHQQDENSYLLYTLQTPALDLIFILLSIFQYMTYIDIYIFSMCYQHITINNIR